MRKNNAIYHVIDEKGNPFYKSLGDCINSNFIYDATTWKNGKLTGIITPVWSDTEFINEYQKIEITDDKIIIDIKEI